MQPHQQSTNSPSHMDFDCSLDSALFQPNLLNVLSPFESFQLQNAQCSFPVNANHHVTASGSVSMTDYEPVPTNQVTPKVAKLLQEQKEEQHRECQTMRSQCASTSDMPSLLHTTCKLFPHSRVVVESALQLDPEATSLEIPTLCSTRYQATNSRNLPVPDINSTSISNYYSFPINIALQHEAAIDVIELLVESDPNVLTKRDGPNQTGSLSTAISTALPIERKEVCKSSTRMPETCTEMRAKCAQGKCSVVPIQPCRMETPTRMDKIVALILRANRDCAKIVDRRNNTALHYLARCENQVSRATISLIYSLHPEALHMRNWLGQTPLQVAQRNLHMSDVLLEHWIHLSFGRQEYALEQSLNQIDVEIAESELSFAIGGGSDASYSLGKQGCTRAARPKRAADVLGFSPTPPRSCPSIASDRKRDNFSSPVQNDTK
jgi:hypothetical protein